MDGFEDGSKHHSAAEMTPTMIGHRPMCALASATRFAEFPRQERINSLRQHLIRYELFPARRDPETAPIRMEELKGLVRKWKLHHERNFWRNHQSKDQVVNALHAHMRERRRLDELKKEIAEKRILLTQQQHGGAHGPGSPHKQLAGSQTPDGKSRRHQTPPLDGAAGGDGDATKARRSMEAHPFDGRDGRRAASADDALAKGREHADDDEDASAKSTWTPLHERADDGKDFWANADQAMIYLSRGFGNDFERIDPRSPPPRKPRTDSLLSNGDPDGTSTAAASALITATEDAAGGGGSGAATPQLAGGAGGAGGGDAKADDVDDAKKLGVKRKCSNALLNMSTNDRMKAQFIEQGGLKALLHLGLSTPDHEVVTNCTACLVNLIAFGDYYEPFQLLEAGVVPALVKIAHAFGVGAPFGYDARIIQYCALSLCALSAQNEIEEWLIRDGLVPALTRLLRSGGAGDGGTVAGSGASVASGASGASADGGNGGVATNQFTRQVATKALVNIVCVMEGNQAESLVKNVMNTLADIVTHTPTLEARQLCADAIKSLSCLPVARPILQKQGVIATIKAILIGSKRAETTNACCIALCNMGMLHNCRKEMLSLGVIKLLSRLLKVGTLSTKQLCVLCLTTLSSQKDLRSAMLREGALRTIGALVANGEDEQLTRQGARALLNFAFDPVTREDILHEGALPALMALLRVDDDMTRYDGLCALCNLLADRATHRPVLEANVIDALVELMAQPALYALLSYAWLNIAFHERGRALLATSPKAVDAILALMRMGGGQVEVLAPPLDSKPTTPKPEGAAAKAAAAKKKAEDAAAGHGGVDDADDDGKPPGPTLEWARTFTEEQRPLLAPIASQGLVAGERSAGMPYLIWNGEKFYSAEDGGFVLNPREAAVLNADPREPSYAVEALGRHGGLENVPQRRQVLFALLLQTPCDALGYGAHVTDVALRALVDMSFDPTTHAVLFKAGVVAALSQLLARPRVSAARRHLCTLLLHSLSANEDGVRRLIADSAVLLLVQLANANASDGDDTKAGRRPGTGGKGKRVAPRGDPAATAEMVDATRSCVAATFYNLSQRKPLVDHGFLPSLITLANTNENLRVLWAAMTFSNLSTFPKGRAMLGRSRQVIPCLSAMMRSGCQDAERIQYHCAVALCNALSTFLNKADVLAMIGDNTVQDLIVITVLRVNDVQTKQVLSKSLFNLLSRTDTRRELTDANVPMAMIRLTRVENAELNLLTMRMLHNYSCEADAYVDKFKEMAVVRVMIDQCTSPAGGVAIKRCAGATLANLSFQSAMIDPIIREAIVTGVSAIAAAAPDADATSASRPPTGGGASDDGGGSAAAADETTDHCATVLCNLAKEERCRDELAAQGAVPVVKALVRSGGGTTRQLGIATLCNISCAKAEHAREELVAHCVELLCETIREPHHTLETRLNATRTCCNLVVFHTAAREAAVKAELTVAMALFFKVLHEEDDKAIVAKVLRDLSWYSDGRVLMLNQGATATLLRLAKMEAASIKHDVATALCNLTSCRLASPIVEEGVVEALFWITLQDCLGLTTHIMREASVAVRYLLQHPTLLPNVALEDKLLAVLVKLSRYGECADTRYNAAVSLYLLLGYEPAQKVLVRKNVVPVVIELAGTGAAIKEVCSAALHQLPNALLRDVDGSVLDVLMSLLTMQDADFADPALFQPDRELAAKGGWELCEAVFEVRPPELKPSWPTMVVDRAVSTFLPARYQSELFAALPVDPEADRRLGASAAATGFDSNDDVVGAFVKMRAECTEQSAADFKRPLPGEGAKPSGGARTSDDRRHGDGGARGSRASSAGGDGDYPAGGGAGGGDDDGPTLAEQLEQADAIDKAEQAASSAARDADGGGGGGAGSSPLLLDDDDPDDGGGGGDGRVTLPPIVPPPSSSLATSSASMPGFGFVAGASSSSSLLRSGSIGGGGGGGAGGGGGGSRRALSTDVTGMFESHTKAQPVAHGAAGGGSDEQQGLGASASAGALPRRKTKRLPTKNGDVKQFLASQRTRQQDRIADDYYRLLHLA